MAIATTQLSGLLALVLVAALAAPETLRAEDKTPKGMPQMTPEDLDRMNKAMAPGKPHELLAKQVGSWSYETSNWMAPGAEPMKTTGTIGKAMIMGGRYLEETYKGEYMGMPSEGRFITGYDNVEKQYKAIWIDNMRTGVMVISGPASTDNKTIEMRGEYLNPVTGQKEALRTVTRIETADRHVFEYHTKRSGQPEFKAMEIVMTRTR